MTEEAEYGKKIRRSIVMLRSMYSGVSGLRTHQTKMDVIGNNIANVNTTAYKSMSINFSDLMYQTTQAATGPNAKTGTAGTNPRQIGLGVQTAAISTKITEQGATQSTGNPFDLKIAGSEFFIVSNGVDTFFTRDGSFYVDAAGNLAMSSTGYNVMGWEVDPQTMNIKPDTVKPLKVMGDNETYGAEWTQSATASGIVDWNDANQGEAAGKMITLQIYDNVGFSYTAKMSIHNADHPIGGDYQYYVELEDIVDSTGKSILDQKGNKDGVVDAAEKANLLGAPADVDVSEVFGLAEGSVVPGTATHVAYYVDDTADPTKKVEVSVNLCQGDDGLFKVDGTPGEWSFNDGYEVKVTMSNGEEVTYTAEDIFATLYGGAISMDEVKTFELDPSTLNMKVTNKHIPNGIILTYDGKDGVLTGVQGGGGDNNTSATLDLSSLGEAFTKINIDFSKTLVSDNKGKSTIEMAKGDVKGLETGRAIGTLQGVSIQTNGMIYASYSNGQKRLLGQIAVAEFANASGLQKEGNNLYSATQNSGDFNGIGIDISANGHSMNTGVLEMSNVDLSSEFTEMITTQRGFQANSRIITVSDTLLEELVNLKR